MKAPAPPVARIRRRVVGALELPGSLLRAPARSGLRLLTFGLGGALFLGTMLRLALGDRSTIGGVKILAGTVAASACWTGVAIAYRWPRTGLGLTCAGVTAYAFLDLPLAPVWLGLLVNVFFVALSRPTGESFLITVVAVAGGLVVANRAVAVPFTWMTVSQLGWFFAAGAAGSAVRSQLRYAAEAHGRAVWAERTREQEAHRRVMDERLRIARELHDAVGHGLALINIQAGIAGRVLDRDPEAARTALERISGAAAGALAEMRGTLGMLTGDPGGEDASQDAPMPRGDVTTLVDDARAAGLPVTLTVDGGYELTAVLRTTAYRVVQEALTNVVKHATGVTAVRVSLRYGSRTLDIEVVDDGVATPGDEPGGTTGHGLRSMGERVRAVGGELRAGPEPGGGFRIGAVLPLRVTP